ncbi:hypothetical protein GWK47_010245 [Chionoecetes opilio]|uniref:Uncharacterized protein n=1 Tax=Chionoecetes opilio TaxID=41210 RepID=A0A8J5CMU4_CHIOP|nr:hypothetical protein GWK47_010245 [Chionoecetes opilio]
MSKCRPYLIGLQRFTFYDGPPTPDPDSQPLHPWTRLRTLASKSLKEKVSPYYLRPCGVLESSSALPDACHEPQLAAPRQKTRWCAPKPQHTSGASCPQRHQPGSGPFTPRSATPRRRVGRSRNSEPQQRTDPSYTRLRDCVTSGFPPNRYTLPQYVQPAPCTVTACTQTGGWSCMARELWFCSPPPPHSRSAARQSPRCRSHERRAQQTVFWPVSMPTLPHRPSLRAMPDPTAR